MHFLLLMIASTGLVFGQASATVQVVGGVKQSLALTTKDLAQMPRASLQIENDSVHVIYEGVWLHHLLKQAGAPGGEELRGKTLAIYVLAHASDGYQVVFSLAELDPAFVDSQVLLADQANGKPLPPAQGPFRLVTPKDKRSSRSIRMLTKIEVVLLRKQ